MKRLLLGLSLVAAMAVPVQAQVHVQIGFQLPGPPPFVVIPGTPVYYAPQAPANVSAVVASFLLAAPVIESATSGSTQVFQAVGTADGGSD